MKLGDRLLLVALPIIHGPATSTSWQTARPHSMSRALRVRWGTVLEQGSGALAHACSNTRHPPWSARHTETGGRQGWHTGTQTGIWRHTLNVTQYGSSRQVVTGTIRTHSSLTRRQVT